MTLIIVESPTKARTFRYFIKNKDYEIIPTLGHIRDLPKNRLAINYQKDFLPDFEIIPTKKKVIKLIKDAYKKDNKIIFATDPDREGESISYHIAYILGFVEKEWPEMVIKKNNLKRIVFHEITASAIKNALANPHSLRIPLIKAQMTRRILDRIVGYELSPILWKKTGKKWLSAGRVQTVALRLIVEREKEIKNFKKEKYYQVNAEFFSNQQSITSRLFKMDNQEVEIKTIINLFDGQYQYSRTIITDDNKEKIFNDLKNDTYYIFDIKKNENFRYPPPPFTTSLLQQQAFNQLKFSSKLTMKLAQDLYENGLITYHRTDSFNLSRNFLFKAKDYVINNFGEKYSLPSPRVYKTKSKMAQEAHEAIRPTMIDPSPKKIKSLTKNHKRLYDLIFRRAIATQMKEAKIEEITIIIKGQKNYYFMSNLEKIIFDGFLKILHPKIDDKLKAQSEKKYQWEINERLKVKDFKFEEKETQPPPRYTEASLIKSLEEKGIGRPSTYAQIVSLILSKNYIERYGRFFIPTVIGEKISDFLALEFPKLFDLKFTALMEDDLDAIANENKDHLSALKLFYQQIKEKMEKINLDKTLKIEEETEEKCPNCQSPLVIRYSRYGKFLACSRFPQCKFTKKINFYVKNVTCPKCQGRLVVKFTKSRKRFYGCENYPQCDFSSWKLPSKK